jgi:hypothetical protein
MMVQGEMVLLRGVWIGTLYKKLGSTINDGCNHSIILEIIFEEGKTPAVSREKTMIWHQRLGHIIEKGIRVLHGKGIPEGMLNFSLDIDLCGTFLVWEVELSKILLWFYEGKGDFKVGSQ